jgi:hypothetical protein
MNESAIELEIKVTDLTSQFSEISTRTLIALNSGELTAETRELVTQSEVVAQNYKFALENFLIAMDKESPSHETEHRIEWARKMRALLSKEMDILLNHPTLAKYA